MTGGFKSGTWNARQRGAPIYLGAVANTAAIRHELLTEAYSAALADEPGLTPEQFAQDVLDGKRKV